MQFDHQLPQTLTNFWRDEAGTSPLESALIGSLVLVVGMLLLLAWRKNS